MTGARLSGASSIPYSPNDYKRCLDLVRRYRHRYERVVVVLEGVYSMDGDFPDLPRFIELRHRHKILLMADEAHAFGGMGAAGHRLRERFGLAGADVAT